MLPSQPFSTNFLMTITISYSFKKSLLKLFDALLTLTFHKACWLLVYQSILTGCVSLPLPLPLRWLFTVTNASLNAFMLPLTILFSIIQTFSSSQSRIPHRMLHCCISISTTTPLALPLPLSSAPSLCSYNFSQLSSRYDLVKAILIFTALTGMMLSQMINSTAGTLSLLLQWVDFL